MATKIGDKEADHIIISIRWPSLSSTKFPRTIWSPTWLTASKRSKKLFSPGNIKSGYLIPNHHSTEEHETLHPKINELYHKIYLPPIHSKSDYDDEDEDDDDDDDDDEEEEIYFVPKLDEPNHVVKDNNHKQHFTDSELASILDSEEIHNKGRIIIHGSIMLPKKKTSQRIQKVVQAAAKRPIISHLFGTSQKYTQSLHDESELEVAPEYEDIGANQDTYKDEVDDETGDSINIEVIPQTNELVHHAQEEIPNGDQSNIINEIAREEFGAPSLKKMIDYELQEEQISEPAPLSHAGPESLDVHPIEIAQSEIIDELDNIPESSIFDNQLLTPTNIADLLQILGSNDQFEDESKYFLPEEQLPLEADTELHEKGYKTLQINHVETNPELDIKSMLSNYLTELVRKKVLPSTEMPPKIFIKIPADHDKAKLTTVPYVVIVYPKQAPRRKKKLGIENILSFVYEAISDVKKELKNTDRGNELIVHTILKHINIMMNNLMANSTPGYVVGYLSNLLLHTVLEDLTMESIKESIERAQNRNLNLQSTINKKLLVQMQVRLSKQTSTCL